MKTSLPGSQNWPALMEELRDMAAHAQLRANNLLADEEARVRAQATADAYLFAVQMIDIVYYAPPKGANIRNLPRDEKSRD
jgi:hypothetical protein